MVLPIKGFSRRLPSRQLSSAPPAPSPKHAENVSGSPRQTAPTWCLSPNMEPVWSHWGGRGWGTGWVLLAGRGPRGEPAGEADITPAAAL